MKTSHSFKEKGKGTTMNQFRGVMLLCAGAFALYEGWKLHTGVHALWAYGLGVLAIGVGLWRLLRKEPPRLA
jgi:cytochrome c-type biogenesis protein CcmH/NrfF